MLIVDTGVLLAAADTADPDHLACAELLEHAEQLVTTALVIAETAYLIDRQLGPAAEAGFFRSLARGDLGIEPLTDATSVSSDPPIATPSTSSPDRPVRQPPGEESPAEALSPSRGRPRSR